MTLSKSLLLLVASLVAPALSAQSSYTFFGQGCQPPVTNKTPKLIVEGRPALGDAFTVAVDDGGRVATGFYFDFLVTGISNTTWGVNLLPFTSPILSNCPLLVSPDLILAVPPGGYLSFSFSVPQDPSLVGAQLYQQWIIGWNPSAAPPAVFGTSDGGIALIGF